MSETYMDQVLAGRALWTDADDFVNRWHESGGGQELHNYLGMSWNEYALWTERPETLRLIIAAHKFDEPVEKLLARQDEVAIAARGLSPADADSVRSWLQQTGRLPGN